MPREYTSAEMWTDGKNRPMPQEYDPATQDFKIKEFGEEEPTKDVTTHSRISTLTSEVTALKQLIQDQQAGTAQSSVTVENQPVNFPDSSAHTKLDTLVSRVQAVETKLNDVSITNTPNVQLTGRNVADGTNVSEVSFEKDPNGYNALRIIDSAPFAYDELLDKLRVTNETNVLLESATNVLVASKGYVDYAVNQDMADFKEIRVSVRWANKPALFSIRVVFNVAGAWGPSEVVSFVANDDTNAGYQKFDVKSGEIRHIRIENNADVDDTIQGIEIRGIR